MLDTPSSAVLGERMEPMRTVHHRDEVESQNAVLTSASLPFVDVGRSNKPSRRHIPYQVRSIILLYTWTERNSKKM